ncbi:MAG: ribonuclease R [Hyphomicrobiaceae bacterium]
MTRRSSVRRPQSGASPSLPTREEIIAFVEHSDQSVGKREIARAFRVRGRDRRALKELLTDMADEGLLTNHKRALRKPGALSKVSLLVVTGSSHSGALTARPVTWDTEDGTPPTVILARSSVSKSRERTLSRRPPTVGDRVLTRIEQHDGGSVYRGVIIKHIPHVNRRHLGIFQSNSYGGGRILPVERKVRREWQVPKNASGNADDGDLVHFEIIQQGRNGVSQASVVDVLGNPGDQRQLSLIAVHAHGIPHDFPGDVIDELNDLPRAESRERMDLRHMSLVTIDPADARDHDDAIHAEPDSDSGNSGGWIVTIAIADVSHYVRPGTRIDREAQRRGNSVYFPDRVVSMLPERISNDLCSLREGEDRPCLAVQIIFDKSGTKRSHTFTRAIMRSAKKLTYEEAQRVFDGQIENGVDQPVVSVLNMLWRAFHSIRKARARRAPLDLEIPERKIILDTNGNVERVTQPPRLESHKLVEEFMIQANVAAAETLEKRRTPLLYRAHNQPATEKVKALGDFLRSVGVEFVPSQTIRPEMFNRVLSQTRGKPDHDMVCEVILRSQAQAEYVSENYGHFGLNLQRYAHFTSPIRRYADLIVHRALVRTLALGKDGLRDEDIPDLAELGEHVSQTERRAMAAERETFDRLITTHLADRVGEEFFGQISGVSRSGLFVRLRETGADGFVPASSLHDDFYYHAEDQHALVGERSGLTYRLGDRVEVRLVEVTPVAGGLRFEMLTRGKQRRFATARRRRGQFRRRRKS